MSEQQTGGQDPYVGDVAPGGPAQTRTAGCLRITKVAVDPEANPGSMGSGVVPAAAGISKLFFTSPAASGCCKKLPLKVTIAPALTLMHLGL